MLKWNIFLIITLNFSSLFVPLDQYKQEKLGADFKFLNCSSRLPTSDGSASKGKQQTSEPVHILKRSFARTVSVVSNIKNLLHFMQVHSYLEN